jgi:hypothetical protein
MTLRNRINPVSHRVSRICDQYLVLAIAELLNKPRVLRRRVRMLLESDLLVIDQQSVALIDNLVTRRAPVSLSRGTSFPTPADEGRTSTF